MLCAAALRIVKSKTDIQLRSGTHRRKKICMAKKDQAAVRLGRKGGKATAKKLTPEQRRASARRAAQARWASNKNS